MSPASATLASGFYGKVPWAGDFVQRRLPLDLVQAWDAYLGTLLPVLPTLAIGPCAAERPWAFLCAPRLCGADAWAGVVTASVDRVGRRFPLLIARPLVADALAGGLLTDGLPWFAAAIAVLADVRDGAIACNEALEARVAALPVADPDITVPQPAQAATTLQIRRLAWQRCLAVGGSTWWRDPAAIPCQLPGLPAGEHCRQAFQDAGTGMETA